MTATLSGTIVGLAIVLGAGAAQAADPLVGAVIGAGAGAAIGQVVGGRDGAMIGGAIGAVTGATVSTHRPRVIVGTGQAMAPMAVIAPAPRMMPVQEGYYDGPDIFYGPYPPPPRGPGQWRLVQDSYGATYWVWEPAVLIAPPPVYTVPVYPTPIYPAPVYPPRRHHHSRPYQSREYYSPPPPRFQPQPPHWGGQPPRWGGPPSRHAEPVRAPAYRPPAASPPAHRHPSGPPPQYRPPPGR